MAKIDEPVNIREGEELDSHKVEAYIRDSLGFHDGEFLIRQFPSGFSNLTYMVKAGDKEMVLRRPPFGKKAKTAHDMHREYRILSALHPVFPMAPKPLLYTEDPEIMGCPFYVMERIQGIILRKNLPKDLVLLPEDAGSLCENMIRCLHTLHTIDYKKIGLDGLGKPEGYIRRQVEGWSTRYRDARTSDAPDYEKVMEWLHDKMPKETDRPGIIHNDYKLDNVVLNPANLREISGILDWEMATIGDPLMDLGGSLAYWVDRNDSEEHQLMRLLPTTEAGMMTRKELVDYYIQVSGRKIESMDYYFCFGLFKLAGIAQQIYYRYFHGQTKDKRFAMLIGAVMILEKVAMKVIEKSDL
jgi:aminoglycoside phosphotransferase (APT) family kinase protein